MIALETELTDDLIRKGLAREFVNKVQLMRKEADLDVVKRIRIEYRGDDQIREAVNAEQDYIRNETLCDELIDEPSLSADVTEWDLNGLPCRIRIR